MTFKPPFPKEHGSWAMLIVPLFLGLTVAPLWRWRAIWLLVAAFGFFLIRYPLATLVKTRRRVRSNRSNQVDLWSWVIIYGLITTLSGGWLVLGHSLWWLAGMGAVGALLLIFHLWLVSRRQEMSVTGELSGIFGLALGAPMAYYVAGDRLDGTAAALWLINALYFGGTVFYIKLKVRQQPRLPAPDGLGQRLVKAKACLAYQTAALTVIILLAAFQQAPLLIPLALVPATIKVVHGASRWQDRKSLNIIRLGVTEIIHALAFAGLVVVAFP